MGSGVQFCLGWNDLLERIKYFGIVFHKNRNDSKEFAYSFLFVSFLRMQESKEERSKFKIGTNMKSWY
jgi:hypothetical protein